jgi:hypothetical protein
VEANARASLLEQRLGDLKAMLDDMRGQRDDIRGERDHWREQAQRLALADQREQPVALRAEPERRSWWKRLAG